MPPWLCFLTQEAQCCLVVSRRWPCWTWAEETPCFQELLANLLNFCADKTFSIIDTRKKFCLPLLGKKPFLPTKVICFTNTLKRQSRTKHHGDSPQKCKTELSLKTDLHLEFWGYLQLKWQMLLACQFPQCLLEVSPSHLALPRPFSISQHSNIHLQQTPNKTSLHVPSCVPSLSFYLPDLGSRSRLRWAP